jgi:hypothetical protein
MRFTKPGFLASVLLAGTLLGCSYTSPHPADDELKAIFSEQRDTFRELEDLFLQHPEVAFISAKVGRLHGEDDSREFKASGNWHYDQQPFADFGDRLEALKANWGLQHCKETPNQWMLFLNCQGLHPSTTCKGYIWSSDTLSPLLDSLAPPAKVDKYDRGYVKLEGNWYLLHEKWPGYDDRCLPRS